MKKLYWVLYGLFLILVVYHGFRYTYIVVGNQDLPQIIGAIFAWMAIGFGFTYLFIFIKKEL